jgi:nucleotide-binding universal stress UspA family protein
MSTNQPQTVVVGFDRADDSAPALRWAAHEAARRQAELAVMHAGYYLYDPALAGGKSAAAAAADSGEYLQRLTAEALQVVAEAEPELVVHTLIRQLPPVKALLEESRSADLLVLGSHVENSLAGAVLGSISQSVAAHAHCPLVVIGSKTGEHAVPRNTVLVGISDSEAGLAALRFACEEASSSGASLTMLRGWDDTEWLTVGIGWDPGIIGSWRNTQEAVLDEAAATVAKEFPQLAVHRLLTVQPPQWALEREALGARLLVVGTRHRDEHWPSRLGPIASWLLHRCPCPIAVVGQPAGTERPAPGAVGEASSPH